MKFLRRTISILLGTIGALCTSLSRVGAADSAGQELAEMFKQDQSERIDLPDNATAEQCAKVNVHDKEHRERVLTLMKEDKIQTGDDYYHAAMIMQHGGEAKSYMLAHVLATAAAIKGNKDATWLSAASFDRLMQGVGQPQIFGTQFKGTGPDSLWTQDPIDPDLIPDTVRKVFDVPTLAENQARRDKMNAELKGSK
jgi:hypothetical protein